MRRSLLPTTLLSLLLPIATGSGVRAQSFAEHFEVLKAAAARDEGARRRLGEFLTALPKGGDLHSHLSGAVAVPDLLAIAEGQGLDLVFRTGRSVFCGFSKSGRGNRDFPDEGCLEGRDVEELPARVVRSDPGLTEVVREALTVDPGERDGEATAFAEFVMVFGRLDGLTDRPVVMAEMVRTLMRGAFRNHVSYLELKVNPIGRTEATLTDQGWQDLPVAIEDVAEGFRRAIQDENRRLREEWAASTSHPGPWPAGWPNPVEVRFIVGGNRTTPLREGGVTEMDPVRCTDPRTELCPDRLRQAYYLSTVSPWAGLFVGIDFVGLPEVDFPTEEPLGQILSGLAREFGPVNLTLHAGETRNPHWRDHVLEALDAGARRIGHGLNMESSPAGLARFCDGAVLLETSLSSNLATNLVGDLSEHPFPDYFRGTACGPDAGYRSVSLNTDDGGVFETDLSAEFLKAVLAFDLTWEEVKRLVRNSILFAFADSGTKAKLLQRWKEEVAELESGWSW